MLVHHHVPTLAMLLACAHAFNAYVRDGSVNFRTDSSGNQRRSAGANGRYVSKGSSYYDRSWQEIESNRRRSVRVHAGLGKRKNEVNVVPSYEPTEPNSMAIDQDGTDLSYFSTVRFGSSGKKLRLLLDTAGANTWIMGSSCKSEACILHDSFGEADSSTLSMTEKPWKLNYGAGGVSGLIANDKVSFAGIEITMDFGLASTVSDEFRGNPFDGILGLGRPNTGELDVPPLLDILRDQKVLKANTFGINLQRQSDNSNDGAIIFGDWNRSRVDGDLNWISTSPQSKLWEVPVDDAVIDSKPAGFPGKRAIIDTGSSFLLLPPDDAKKLFDAFPGSQSNGDQYRLPCSSGTVLEFKLGGEAYDMSPEDYLGPPSDGGMCESNILARQTFHPDQWILGASFLRNVYTVFDYDQNRVGKKLADSS